MYWPKISVITQTVPAPEQLAYTETQSIYAESVKAKDMILRGAYNETLWRLKAGNIALALNAVTSGMYDKFSKLFTGLGADLPTRVDQLGGRSQMDN